MTSIRRIGLLIIGLAIQLGLGLASTPPYLLALSMVFIILFVLLNRRHPGFKIVLLGMTLNMMVMAANGSMPVSGSALEATHGRAVPAADLRHVEAGGGTRLSFLGDVIPFGGRIFSVGDVLMLGGLATFVCSSCSGLRQVRPA